MTYSIAISPALNSPDTWIPFDAGSLYLSDGTYLTLVPHEQTVSSTLCRVYDLFAVDANRTSATLVVADVLDTVARVDGATPSYVPGICRDSANGIYVVFGGSGTNWARYLTKGAGLTWSKGSIVSFAVTTNLDSASIAWCNTGGGTSAAGHLMLKKGNTSAGSSVSPAYVLDAGLVKAGSGSPLVSTVSGGFPGQYLGSCRHHLLPNDAPGAVGAIEGWWAHTSNIAGGQFGFWSVSSAGVGTISNFGNAGSGADAVRLLRTSSTNALLVHRSTTAAKVGVTSLTRTAVGTFQNSIHGDGITGWPTTTPGDWTTRRWDAAYDRAFNKVWIYTSNPNTSVVRVGGTLVGTTSITWDTTCLTEASGLTAFTRIYGPPTAPPGSRWDWLTYALTPIPPALVGGSTLFNQAPYAPTLNTPANGATVDLAVTQRLSFTFADPDAGDSLSKFDIQWRLGAGAWNTVTRITPNAFWDADPATFPAGSIEWQARTYDAVGTVGPYSASFFFTAATTPGVPSITAPTSGSTVASVTGTVTWSVATQTDYQVRKVADIAGVADTATVYYDTGDVLDAVTRSVVLSYPVNARWEHVQVRVKAAGLWSAWADSRVWVNYDPPMTPTIILTPVSASASISVGITNPTPVGPAPVTSYNDVYASSPLDPEIRVATGVPPNSTWTWWTPAAGRVYTIRVVAVGTTGTTASSV